MPAILYACVRLHLDTTQLRWSSASSLPSVRWSIMTQLWATAWKSSSLKTTESPLLRKVYGCTVCTVLNCLRGYKLSFLVCCCSIGQEWKLLNSHIVFTHGVCTNLVYFSVLNSFCQIVVLWVILQTNQCVTRVKHDLFCGECEMI